MTVRAVAETLHRDGPSSRAELSRRTGIAAPTVNKVVNDLVRQKLAEETAHYENSRGRPGMKVCLARQVACVVGVSVGATATEIVTSTLCGEVDGTRVAVIPHPADYPSWLRAVTDEIRRLTEANDRSLLGIGISLSGLVVKNRQLIVSAPDLPLLNEKSPSEDLRKATGLMTVTVPVGRSLCTAERLFGSARGMDDFVVLDATSVISVGALCGGELLTGTCGLAGPLGQPVAARDGAASESPSAEKLADGTERIVHTGIDSQLMAAAGRIMGCDKVSLEQLRDAADQGLPGIADVIQQARSALAEIVESAISIYDPSALLVYSILTTLDPGLISDLESRKQTRAVAPHMDCCSIRAVSVSPQQAAAAGVIEHLIQSLGPRMLRSSE